jgi:hypothetical protein
MTTRALHLAHGNIRPDLSDASPGQGWTRAVPRANLTKDGKGSDGPVIQGCGVYYTSHPTMTLP